MLATWLYQRSLLDAMSEAAELDLGALGCDADDETVTDTAIAQPLIVAAGLLSYAELGTPPVDVVAGHSVGELTALAVAGVITAPQAVRLAAVRGRAMATAASLEATSMAAIVGGARDDVERAIAASGAVVANVNSARQIVAAGTVAQLHALAENPPPRVRVIPLAVAGAFHTPFMALAVPAVQREIDTLEVRDPHCTLLTNRDGSAVTTGAEALAHVVAQITSPVRWDLCQARLSAAAAIVELAPGGVLTGLAKHELRGIPAVPLTSPEDIPAARTLLEETSA